MRWRRRGLPKQLRPALGAEERVVAWALAGDGAVVATNRGLFLPGRPRLGWHEIHKAAWTGRDLVVTPADVVEERAGYQVTADAPPVRVSLADPGRLPHTVRTRVTRSVSLTSHHPVPGGAVRVVGRRVPGVDGVSWTVRYEDGANSADPDVIAVTDRLVAALAAAQQAG